MSRLGQATRDYQVKLEARRLLISFGKEHPEHADLVASVLAIAEQDVARATAELKDAFDAHPVRD